LTAAEKNERETLEVEVDPASSVFPLTSQPQLVARQAHRMIVHSSLGDFYGIWKLSDEAAPAW